MKIRWNQLGGQLGLGFCVVGFVFVFLGWNGAASYDRVPSQVPYLVSGGIAGLCFVVIGVGLMLVQNMRTDRAALQHELAQVRDTLERLAAIQSAGRNGGTSAGAADAGLVALGPTTYHRPACRLLEGRTGVALVSVDDARERGLSACRVCGPDDAEAPATAGRRGKR